nr:nucleoside diphosphate kinase homolog 5-like [Leptinotarsa decemlineata]
MVVIAEEDSNLESVQCDICEMALKEIKNIVKSDHTEAEIGNIVHGICEKLPGFFGKECDKLVDEYGKQIIDSLVNKVDCEKQRLLHLSPEQVSDIYSKHYGSPSFPHLVVSLSISPLLVLSLAGKNAVEKWKTMIGPYGQLREEWFYPYSVRTRFGIQPDIPDVIHASETIADAKWENRYFYPRSILEPITADEAKVNDYLKNWVCPTLQEGLIQVVHMKPINPLLFLAEWLLLNNPYQPKFPERIAVSPL